MVGTGRVRDLPDDRRPAARRSPPRRGEQVVAEVRSAVALTDDQKARLAAALKASAPASDVDVVVVVDPTVLGGIVTQIGDTVIDGSVRPRLTQLRESF